MALLARLLIRGRGGVLAALIALLVASAWSLPRVGVDLSILPLLEADPGRAEELRAFEEELPPVGFHLYALLEWDEPLAAPQVEALAQIGDALVQDPAIAEVVSLATVTVVDRGGVLPRPAAFRDQIGARTVRQAAEEHPLLLGRLVSRDGRAASLCLRFGAERADVAAIQERLRVEVQRRAPEVARVHFVGGALVQAAMSGLMMSDMVRSVVLETLVFALLLPLLFRSVRGSLLPLLVVLSAILLNFGWMVLVGWPVSLLGVAVPGLILILGLCDSVHMMHRFEECRRDGLGWHESIVEMMRRVGRACLYTSFTTGLGFLSLLVSEHAAVRAFGVRASVAVGIAFLTVLLLLPVSLAFWPGRSMVVAPRWRWLPRGHGRRRLTLAVAALVGVVSVFGVSRAAVDSRWMEELPADHEVASDLRWFEQRFGGVLRMDLRVEGDLDSPAVFAFLEDFQDRFVAEPGVSSAESYTHWVREVLGPDARVDALRLQGALRALDLAGDQFPGHVLSRDHRRGRMQFLLEDRGSQWFSDLQARMDRHLRDLPAGAEGRVDGYLQMAQQSSRLVVTTLLKSFGVSLLSITLFIAWSFRSLRLGLVSVLPNVLPILVALGLNGFAGIPLRIGIVMIYSLGLGLAVDDTIHFLARYREERRRRPDAASREVVGATFRSTGRVLIETSLLLIGGALCYLPSGFRSMFDVGVLLTTIVATALLADLFLLPVLLEWSERRRGAPRNG